MRLRDYIKTKDFWKQFGIMVGASILIVLITMFFLKLYTRHGQEYQVPDFSGHNVEELTEYTAQYGFQFIIIDSVFQQDAAAGAILRQDPLPNSLVKQGRKFYLTVAAGRPEMLSMPDLVDLSVRQATSLLETYGLKVGTITYGNMDEGASVSAQIYNGQPIAPQTPIRKGDRIDIMVGNAVAVDSAADFIEQQNLEQLPE